MASGPDLFVVCKSCGAEVSPYITECPYCGTRLRKRAPKLERGGKPKAPKPPAPAARARCDGARSRASGPTGARTRRSRSSSSPWWSPCSAPRGCNRIAELLLLGPLDGDWWRPVTTQFFYDGMGYEVAALAAIALFGALLERRHGWWAPLAVFLIGGTAGMAAVVAVETPPFAVGGNAAALALLAAWAMRDVLGRRRGREDDADLLGTLAIAALLVLLPVATREADPLAGLVGGVVGDPDGAGARSLA